MRADVARGPSSACAHPGADVHVPARGSPARGRQEPPGRALPDGVIAQLDANLDLLASVPGASGLARVPTLGALGEHAGEMAVLVYELLKGTGRRVGEVAGLRLECLDIDEHGKDVLVYDNHKAARMGRRLPLADSSLVAAIRAQQAWVRDRFPSTPPERLWLLPRPHKNLDGTKHFDTGLIRAWFRAWLGRIPQIDAGPLDRHGEPVPFDRSGIHPHAFRHTYAQTLADQGVPAPVLRDLMDHRSLSTTLGYYKVGDARKRKAMEVLARHTVDNRAVARPSAVSVLAPLREHISWVAVPMGKCSEPANVRAGGQACPSVTSAPAARTSSPTPPTCPSYVLTPTSCAKSVRRCSPPGCRLGGRARRPPDRGHSRPRAAPRTSSSASPTTIGPWSRRRPPPCGRLVSPCRSPSGAGAPAMTDNSAALQRARRQDSRAKRGQRLRRSGDGRKR